MVQIYIIDKSDLPILLRGECLAIQPKGQIKGFCVEIAGDLTNGDIIKTLFPHISVKDNCQKYCSVDIENLSKDKALNTIGFRKEWWDAPYKGGKE